MNFINNKKRTVFIGIFLPLLILLSSCTTPQNTTPLPESQKSNVSTSEQNTSSQEETPELILSASKRGIDMEVSNVKRDDGKTIIEVALSNHVYDLSQMDVSQYSSLAGLQPSQYTIKDSQMGGHHITADVTFDKELSGKFLLGLNEEIQVTFII